MVSICHAPARIIDNNAIRDGLHNIFALARVAACNLCQVIDTTKKAGILNGSPCLLGELFEQLDLLARKTACAPVIYLYRAQHRACRRRGAGGRTFSCTIDSSRLKNRHAQDRARSPWYTFVIEQGNFNLRYDACILNNQAAAVAHDKAHQYLLTYFWMPVLRAQVYASLRCDSDGRSGSCRVLLLKMLQFFQNCIVPFEA